MRARALICSTSLRDYPSTKRVEYFCVIFCCNKEYSSPPCKFLTYSIKHPHIFTKIPLRPFFTFSWPEMIVLKFLGTISPFIALLFPAVTNDDDDRLRWNKKYKYRNRWINLIPSNISSRELSARWEHLSSSSTETSWTEAPADWGPEGVWPLCNERTLQQQQQGYHFHPCRLLTHSTCLARFTEWDWSAKSLQSAI